MQYSSLSAYCWFNHSICLYKQKLKLGSALLTKTKDMVVEFRKTTHRAVPTIIKRSRVETVGSYRYLRTIFYNSLNFNKHYKGLQRLYFTRWLNLFNFEKALMNLSDIWDRLWKGQKKKTSLPTDTTPLEKWVFFPLFQLICLFWRWSSWKAYNPTVSREKTKTQVQIFYWYLAQNLNNNNKIIKNPN